MSIYIGNLAKNAGLELTPMEKDFILGFAQHICMDGPFPSMHESIGARYLRMKLKQYRARERFSGEEMALTRQILYKTRRALERLHMAALKNRICFLEDQLENGATT